MQTQKTKQQHTSYLWDGNRQLQQNTATLTHTIIYEQDSFEPVAQLIWLRDGLTAANDEPESYQENQEGWYGNNKPVIKTGVQLYHYHNDHLGTPNELTNQQGEVIWLADYQAWGNTAKVVWREEKLGQLQVSADELQPIRFQGQSFDVETGLHYNRFRYYDPDLGMFVSRDPIGLMGGSNVFQYAPNPTGWIDPLGLCSTALGKSMGARAGDGMANHHLIPEQLMKLPEFNDMFTALESTGWHGDNASNGIFLPDKSSVKNIDLPGHWSNHKNYTSNVKVDLSTLNAAFKRGELSDLQLALGVKQVQDNARRGLETGKFAVDPCTGRLI